MRHYCTLFDKNYLAKGLVMMESLRRHSSDEFTIYILAMDDATADVLLKEYGKSHYIHPIRLVTYANAMLEEFDADLSPIRASRTWQEYMWTLASQFTNTMFTSDNITYLDADLMFFSDPKVIFDEIGDRSIGIIPHRFIPEKKYLEKNGKFNISWVTFRNTETGIACLNRWAAQCRDWCFYRNENGKFADQKYLDEWPSLYGKECCVIENIGAGTAPWNLANYKVTEGPKVDDVPVVFYHFHEFVEQANGHINMTNYHLRAEDTELIYQPYILKYFSAKDKIARLVNV